MLTIDQATSGALAREFDGPWALANAMIIDGTGAPPYGPAHIIIDQGRIQRIVEPRERVGDPSRHKGDVQLPDHIIDVEGGYVLPGLIDAHAHIGTPEHVEDPQYVYDLWLGHGITTTREAGALGNGLQFSVEEARKAEDRDVDAPRILPYSAFGQGWKEDLETPEDAKRWVGYAAENGARGVKFFGAAPELFEAALQECQALGIGSACHHAQKFVPRTNALITARWGLGSIEHSYGQAEVMYEDRLLPELPPGFNYTSEADRFALTGQLWAQASGPGSARWEDFLDELVELDTTLVPTFAVYVAGRDAGRARGLEWHEQYTSARLEDYFWPNEDRHGAFFFDWGTEEEVAWKENYRLWMRFVRDFSLRGGRVCAGSDGGYIYNLYGFGLIEELELLREAGMSPLEVIRAATLAGAELLGEAHETGSIAKGKRADLLVVGENPLHNLKVLYGTGHFRVTEDRELNRTKGVRLTIRGGVVRDSAAALARAREHVAASRERTPVPRGAGKSLQAHRGAGGHSPQCC